MSHPGYGLFSSLLLPLLAPYNTLTWSRFTCSFWPVTVVFDCNQDTAREDKYAGLSEDEESDPGYHSSRSRGYASSAYGGYGAGRSSSRPRSSSRGRRDSAGFYTGGMGGSQYGGDSDAYSRGGDGYGYGRTSSRRNSYAASGSGRRMSMSGMSSSSSSDSEGDLPPRRGGSYSNSRRGSMSARDIDQLASGMNSMGRLSRSNSRSSMRY